jgi:adenylate kinase
MAGPYRAILLFGAPGVGKGTQGKILGCIPGVVHLATGDMFRSLDRSSILGKEVTRYSARGELVPDDLTIRLWRQHVLTLIEKEEYRPKADVLALDGIPRNLAQAQALDDAIDPLVVVHLKPDSVDAMVERMKKRAKREGRQDDGDETVIRRRFEVYERETAPVLTHYRKELIKEVCAVGSPADVLLNILQVVVPVYDEVFANPLE